MASILPNENLQLILNKTEGYYFIYYGEDYKKVMKSLFEVWYGESRWDRDDKIVFVPAHLREYVMQTYENMFPYGMAGNL